MSNFVMQGYVPGLPSGQLGYLEIGNSNSVIFDGFYIQNSADITYGINILPTASTTFVFGGLIGGGTGTLGSSVNWSGAYTARNNNYLLDCVLTQGFTTGDAGGVPQMRLGDCARYWDATRQQWVESTEGFSPGFLTPYTVALSGVLSNGQLAAGATATADLSLILPQPSSFTDWIDATVDISVGAAGSPNIVKANVLVSSVNYGMAQVNRAGNTSSSAITLGVGTLGSIISIHNTSGAVVDPQVLITMAKGYPGY
jgi:hypothetical protein